MKNTTCMPGPQKKHNLLSKLRKKLNIDKKFSNPQSISSEGDSEESKGQVLLKKYIKYKIER